MQPTGSLAARGQARLPEPIELQLPPQLAGQPTPTPLARAPQLQGTESDLYHIAIQRRCSAVFREQHHLRRRTLILFEHVDAPAPSRLLRIVDLPEVEHLTLHYAPIGDPAVFDNAPVTMLFAVFDSLLGTQKHANSVGKIPLPFNNLNKAT